jgi:large subunit ribosomal protein L24
MTGKWRIRKGDKVQVLTGKDKGKVGLISQVLREKQRVVVEGVQLVARHTKPSAQNPEGGIVRREASIHMSNVALVDPEKGKPTRVGMRFLDDGRKVRYAKLSGQNIDL